MADLELSMLRNPEYAQPIKPPPPPGRRKKRACLICCGSCCLLLVLIIAVLIILAFTVFKPKKPQLHVDSIVLENFYSNIVLNLPPTFELNITLGLVVSVKNPNRVGFKYYNSTSYLLYRDKEVGFVPIPAGEIGPRDTEQISSSLDLLADRLITDLRVYQDLIAGSLPFSTTTKVSGRVDVLHIFKHHVDTTSVCNFDVSLTNATKAVDSMVCSYDYSL